MAPTQSWLLIRIMRGTWPWFLPWTSSIQITRWGPKHQDFSKQAQVNHKWLMDYGPRLGQCGESLPRLRGRNPSFLGLFSHWQSIFWSKGPDVGQICHRIGLLLVTGRSLAPTGVLSLLPVGEGSQSKLTGPHGDLQPPNP